MSAHFLMSFFDENAQYRTTQVTPVKHLIASRKLGDVESGDLRDEVAEYLDCSTVFKSEMVFVEVSAKMCIYESEGFTLDEFYFVTVELYSFEDEPEGVEYMVFETAAQMFDFLHQLNIKCVD